MSLALVAGLAFAWTLWAVLFWGGIAVLDRDNEVNRFSAALGWSAIHLVMGLVMDAAWLLGLLVLVAWLIFLIRLLALRYELGLLHSIGVVVATFLGPYLAVLGLGQLGGSSVKGLLAVELGFAAAVLGTWLWRRRGSEVGEALPRARVARLRRRPARHSEAAPSEPAARSDQDAPGPAPAVAPVARPVASAPAGPVTGEPSFLK
jgi:hypothetical protein